MARTEFTTITGCKKNAPAKPLGHVNGNVALIGWIGDNFRIFQLRGYWEPAEAISYAADRNVLADEIKHVTLDFSGKGIDHTTRKFKRIGGRMQEVLCRCQPV